MRLERKSLFIAITLLFMAGCSANRHDRQSDTVDYSPEPVPMPIRHADEYDSGAGEYDYDPASSHGESPNRSGTPVPPPVPMREPVPAPPALGVSRVKSVSLLRGIGNRTDRNNCGDTACGDVHRDTSQSQLPPECFIEGCITPPHTVIAPRIPCREKTTLVEVIQGWNLRAKTRRAERIQRSRNCGESTACDPGCFAPESCTANVNGDRSFDGQSRTEKRSLGGEPAQQSRHGSLADPLQENDWDDPVNSEDPRFSPDELLDLPSTIETPSSGQQQPNVPPVPKIDGVPVLPMPTPAPASTPAIQDPAAPVDVPQQIAPDAVKRIVRPPMWPRLGSPAATSLNVPAGTPEIPSDHSVPAILPGRRI